MLMNDNGTAFILWQNGGRGRRRSERDGDANDLHLLLLLLTRYALHYLLPVYLVRNVLLHAQIDQFVHGDHV